MEDNAKLPGRTLSVSPGHIVAGVFIVDHKFPNYKL